MKEKSKTVLALGYFDSVHIGHRKVIETAFAAAKNTPVTVFTFGGNLKAEIYGDKEKYVYSATERKDIFNEMGVKNVWFAPVTKEFLGISGEEFLRFLTEKFEISHFVCGKDYRFGKNGAGKVGDLKRFSEEHGIGLSIVDEVTFGKEKVSTSRIKDLLDRGDIATANTLLGRSFSATGKVVSGRKEGRVLGFPTANVAIDPEKQYVKYGVYFGRAKVSGKEFPSVINYGNKPTFGIAAPSLEIHIIGSDENVYGKEITVFFDGFLRDIKKFSDEKELSYQIEKDVKAAESKS